MPAAGGARAVTAALDRAMVLGAMSNDTHAAIPDDRRWLAEVGRILTGLGFELDEPDRTRGEEAAHLFVALRPKPTLHHFDPETIDYWITDGARGRAAGLDRETRCPLVGDYAWGRITLADRLGVKNEFLSFGGTIRAQMTDDTTVLIDFTSHAPILRESGHSQTTDPLAAEVGAFFARIKVPIDFVPGAEALVAKATPQTLYSAFIQHVRERLSVAHALREANQWLAEWSSRESQRMESTANDQWRAAAELRRRLGAIETTGRK
jgi:hypothetical protein